MQEAKDETTLLGLGAARSPHSSSPSLPGSVGGWTSEGKVLKRCKGLEAEISFVASGGTSGDRSLQTSCTLNVCL